MVSLLITAMTMTVSSTTKIVELNGIDCRIWEGSTSSGVKIHCFIPRVAVAEGEDITQFEAELQEQATPSVEIEVYPLCLII